MSIGFTLSGAGGSTLLSSASKLLWSWQEERSRVAGTSEEMAMQAIVRSRPQRKYSGGL